MLHLADGVVHWLRRKSTTQFSKHVAALAIIRSVLDSYTVRSRQP